SSVVGHGRVTFAYGPPYPVEMNDVFTIAVIRSQIGAPAKPAFRSLREITEIRVHGGDERVSRMEDERDPGGGERLPLHRNLGSELRTQFAADMGKIDARFFEYRTIGQHSGPASTAALARPAIGVKVLGDVDRFQLSANAILKLLEILRRLMGISIRWGHR